MARGKGGLGRGLDSLFEDAAPVFESEHAAVETLPLREIEPDPDQPRKTFEQETLSELAASIAEHGLLQPIGGASETYGRLQHRGGRAPLARLPHGGSYRGAGGHQGRVRRAGHGAGAGGKFAAGGSGPGGKKLPVSGS